MIGVRIIILFGFILDANAASSSNYGPFSLELKKIILSRGPKKRDCSINNGRIENDTVLYFNMNVTEDMKDVHGNLYAVSESKQTMRLLMKKLCDHSFWMPFMRQFMNITDDCVLLKGNYEMVVNTQELAEKFFKGSFFYGKWTVKAIYYNNICNLGCTSVLFAIKPK